jgi:hypothetical protein
LEKGYIAINPAFGKLITSLRTAVAEENILEKESTSYPDILDAYRLALEYYQLQTSDIEDDEEKNIKKVKTSSPPTNPPPTVAEIGVIRSVLKP